MTLEIRLRRFPFLPDFIQSGNGEPRWAHFLGKKQPTPVDKPDQSQQNNNPPPSPGKYRPLPTITLGEVREAMEYYMPQMVPAPMEGWVARNYFCQLPVKKEIREQSPVVFGRVNTCFPGDGNVYNIDQMELHFPIAGAQPDLLNIQHTDIQRQQPIQTYCVGIKMFLSATEMDDFRRSENIFVEKGFAPIYHSDTIDLLDINEQNFFHHLWLNVIGSEWLASHPVSLQSTVRERLRGLADWGLVLLNYHPKRYSLQYPSLNDALDLNYGFTKHFLLTPQDTNQVLQKVDEIFGRIFLLGIH